MKVLIADDEPLARSLLRSLLADAGDVEIVGEAQTGGEAVALAERLKPDAVFLDIDMPGGSGIAVAHELQNRSRAQIVFVTAHEPHAVDAYELGAVDYVLKPVRRPRLAKALDRVRARVRESGAADSSGNHNGGAEPAFWLRARHGMVRVPISEILWIEAARDHVYFHTNGQSYMHRVTMAELEGKLQGSGIIRVQRSAFVRVDNVTAIIRRGKSIVLEMRDATQVSVGPTYEAKTLQAVTHAEIR